MAIRVRTARGWLRVASTTDDFGLLLGDLYVVALMRRWTILGVVFFVAAPVAVFASATGDQRRDVVHRYRSPEHDEITRPINDEGGKFLAGEKGKLGRP